MINSLIGLVSYIGAETMHLQVGAMEWQLLMSGRSLQELKVGESLRIYTYLHHKEDVMQLFGFKELSERDLYFNLVKVDGVGPKAALKILSYFSPAAFQEALNAPDAKLLAKAPGLGSKTAQKVMLALKGKLDLSTATGSGGRLLLSTDELLPPLVGMGFDRKLAAEALIKIRAELGEDASEADILRKAITLLS